MVKDEFSRIYSENGAVDYNAFTSKDLTTYTVSLPANKLELWAALESDRWNNAVLREFYTEREVVREERRRSYESNPRGMLYERLLATAFTVHPYRNPIIGWDSDIATHSLDETRRFFRKYYAPANMVIALVMNDYFHVFSELFPNEAGIKFLISDQFHMRDVMASATISVCFTAQPDEMHVLEAWRILRSSVEGFELHTEIVDELDVQLRTAFRPNFIQPLSMSSLYPNRLGYELDWEDREIQDYESDAEENAEDHLDQVETKSFSLDLSHDDFFIENKMRIMICHALPHATSLWSEIWATLVLPKGANNGCQALPTCSPSARGKMFLKDAHSKSFMLRRWHQDEEL
ncbi:MAG: insulinase family protein, partial [Desulfuromonadales bacterium]